MSNNFANLIHKQRNKNSQKQVQEATILKVILIKEKKYILVDASLKVEGIILATEFANNNIEIGAKIPVITVSEQDGYILLSTVQAKKIIHGKTLYKIFLENSPVHGVYVSSDKNVHKINLGNGLFGLYMSDEPVTIDTFYITKIYNNNTHITLSATKPEKRLFKIGEVVSCKCTNIFNNPYFFDIEGVTGIMDVNDYSWNRKEKPILNNIISAQVIDIINGNPVLSAKILQIGSWDNIQTNKDSLYNSTQEAIILEVRDNGLLVHLLNVNSFVARHEISWDYYTLDLNNKFKPGDKIQVKICDIDVSKQRLQLSARALLPNPFDEFVKTHNIGDIINGEVLYNSDQFKSYNFLMLAPGVEGFLQISEVCWHFNDREAMFAKIQKGDKIDVRITNIDMEKKKISVSIKKLKQDNIRNTINTQLNVGQVYACEAIRMTEDGLQIKFVDYPAILGYIAKSEIIGFITMGSVIEARLLTKDKFITLSMKIAQTTAFSISLNESLNF